MNLLTEALMYLEMGWGVYPSHSYDPHRKECSCGKLDCPTPGKHPIGHWLDYQQRLPTEGEVILWFRTLDCNIGTITGRVSGIVVVDVDGKQGKQTLKSLNLAPTLTARTGGGGLHLFYQLDRPMNGRIKALPGIDIRADGGYVVLAPSFHQSGRYYEWTDPPRKMAPFDPTPFERKSKFGSLNDSNWLGEIFEGVPEGSRSLTAAKLSGRYFGLGLSFEETWILMSVWNERNDPPLPDTELKATVKAIQRKHETTTVPIQVETMYDIQRLLKGRLNGHKNKRKEKD